MTLRIIQKRRILFKEESRSLLELGKIFARDFVLVTVVFTTNLMVSSYLRYGISPLGGFI